MPGPGDRQGRLGEASGTITLEVKRDEASRDAVARAVAAGSAAAELGVARTEEATMLAEAVAALPGPGPTVRIEIGWKRKGVELVIGPLESDAIDGAEGLGGTRAILERLGDATRPLRRGGAGYVRTVVLDDGD